MAVWVRDRLRLSSFNPVTFSELPLFSVVDQLSKRLSIGWKSDYQKRSFSFKKWNPISLKLVLLRPSKISANFFGVNCERPGMSIMTPITWVFLLILCSTLRKSTLTCTTSWLVMAIFTVLSRCIDTESKQHSSKSRIYEFSSTEKIKHFVVFILSVCLFVSSVWSVCSSRLYLSAYQTVFLSVCVSVRPVWAVCLSFWVWTGLSEWVVFMSVWSFCFLGRPICQS